MDSETTRVVTHNATDIELQRFPTPPQEQGLNESYAGTRVGDGRYEYGKRHATFYDPPTHRFHSV